MLPALDRLPYHTLVVRHPEPGSTWQLLDGAYNADDVRDRVMRLYQAEEGRALNSQELEALQIWTAALPVEQTFRFRDATHGWCRGRIIQTADNPAAIAARVGELNDER